MTLGQILSDLDAAAGDLCIVARRPWSDASDALLLRLGDSTRLPTHLEAEGYDYFLEVNVIKDEVLGKWAALLDSAQRLAVVLHYAEHDAWPKWFNDFCRTHGRV